MKINEINNLKEEIEIYKKLIDLIFKILYSIEIPTFKKININFVLVLLIKLIIMILVQMKKMKLFIN